MVRIVAPFVGLFFALSALWAFVVGAESYITEPPAATAESVFHLKPQEISFASDGPFGRFDRQQLQRGFQVYSQVCSNCHALKYVAFRDLKDLGYNDDEVKAIAAKHDVPVYNPATGEVKTRKGMPADHFPPVVYAGQGNPPDLSLITKARHEGPAYVTSLLTGFGDQPAEVLQRFPEAKVPDGLYWNPYFANLNIAMPPPLVSDGQVEYGPGNPKPTVKQMATDVAAFLVWTAEPKLEKRHQTGVAVVLFLMFATVLAFMAYRNVWSGVKH